MSTVYYKISFGRPLKRGFATERWVVWEDFDVPLNQGECKTFSLELALHYCDLLTDSYRAAGLSLPCLLVAEVGDRENKMHHFDPAQDKLVYVKGWKW